MRRLGVGGSAPRSAAAPVAAAVLVFAGALVGPPGVGGFWSWS
ncbi:putative membrane protein [Mycobacterium sp. MAC_080597_8934]|nr:putative membrane protein [Mycobacterium sp. MAC_080597_8934]